MKLTPRNPFSRRHSLLVSALLLIGCSQQAAHNPAPVEITRGATCSLDGMTLADYPGPKAQIHYAGQATPDYFCDTMELFAVYLKPEQARFFQRFMGGGADLQR